MDPKHIYKCKGKKNKWGKSQIVEKELVPIALTTMGGICKF
jgi:hypothetical protein